MKYVLILLLFCTSSCLNTFHIVEQPVANLSPKKQRQKIAILQKKLETAEKEQREAQNSVEKLATEIEEAQLALIRKQVDEYEKKQVVNTNLFLEEREALYRIIQTGPGPAAFAAQVELDRILRMITERSEGF